MRGEVPAKIEKAKAKAGDVAAAREVAGGDGQGQSLAGIGNWKAAGRNSVDLHSGGNYKETYCDWRPQMRWPPLLACIHINEGAQ